jgi:hypothetical protein
MLKSFDVKVFYSGLGILLLSVNAFIEEKKEYIQTMQAL